MIVTLMIYFCPCFYRRTVNLLAFAPFNTDYKITENKVPDSNSKYIIELNPTNPTNGLIPKREFDSRYELNDYDVYYSTTSRGNRIVCLYIRTPTNPNKRTIVYSHGNAEDLGMRPEFYVKLGLRTNCNVLIYDYSGYGLSTGQPTEKNLYADIDSVFDSLKSRYKISDENIILFGESIGSVPTIDLASKYKVRGVILQSAILSGLRAMFPKLKMSLPFDPFPNIRKISKVWSPVLIIHGTNDEDIDLTHAKELFKRCQRPHRPLWIEDATHSNCEQFHIFWKRISRFINIEI